MGHDSMGGHSSMGQECCDSARPSVQRRLARAAMYAIVAGLLGGAIAIVLFGTKADVEGPLAYVTGGSIGGAVGGAVGGAMKGWLHRPKARRMSRVDR